MSDFGKQKPTTGEIPLDRDAEGAILNNWRNSQAEGLWFIGTLETSFQSEGDPRGNFGLAIYRIISQVKGQRRRCKIFFLSFCIYKTRLLSILSDRIEKYLGTLIAEGR